MNKSWEKKVLYDDAITIINLVSQVIPQVLEWQLLLHAYQLGDKIFLSPVYPLIYYYSNQMTVVQSIWL
jgi:hypothetical protein